MDKLARFAGLVVMLFLVASTYAQTLTGTVTNGTTKKPAAGDEVILISLANGMDIAGNTKADAAGKFSFTLKDAGGPHLIRAVHQGVNYHQIAPPGTNSVDVNVYDVAPKVTGITVTADVLRFQADSGSLQGVRLFVVNNQSSPPKTQLNDHNFEFYLPPGAKLEQVQARAPNGQPISTEATPQADKNRYALNFPLRPGETQFQLEFTMPYKGELKVDPKPLYPSQHFVVVVPKTMQFAAANPPSFQAMNDPTQGDSQVEVARETKAGQPLAFTIKGQGVINESPAQTASGAAQQQDQSQGQAGTPSSTNDNRPGGGLGAPIDAPDALQKYRWPILGAFAILLAIGGWAVTKRQGAVSLASVSKGSGATSAGTSGEGTNTRAPISASSSTAPATYAARPTAQASSTGQATAVQPTASATQAAAPAPALSKSAMLLEALKEELFQLEVEKKQNRITEAEYEKARTALDQTLDRALKRQS